MKFNVKVFTLNTIFFNSSKVHLGNNWQLLNATCEMVEHMPCDKEVVGSNPVVYWAFVPFLFSILSEEHPNQVPQGVATLLTFF